jgi:hypothetical protein
MIAGEGEMVHGNDTVTSEPGNLPRTVCDLPAENRKRANRLSTLSPLQFNRNSVHLACHQYHFEGQTLRGQSYEYCNETW